MSKHPPPTTHPVVEVILRDADLRNLIRREMERTR